MDKAVIYSKQVDEPRIPVTVRIEWLPNGDIQPERFWMPDGSCYKVKSVDETVPLAYLKDQDVGIRFKVKTEIFETPEMDDNLLHTQYETYLFFRDDWFFRKNFIDGRYEHIGKEFIRVTLDIFPNCDYELIYFSVKGERYMVEKTIAVEPRGSFYAGGVGIWHKVEARQVNDDDDEDPNLNKSVRRLAALYFEVNKWFVTIKTD
jgi:hypothetical protein